MATIREAAGHGATGDCSLCGERSAVVWSGPRRTIELCHSCARLALPGMAADIVPRLTQDGTQDALLDHTSRYWRGIALRLMREPGR